MRDIYAWTMFDPETGEEAVAYVETTGGTRVPLLAYSEKDARSFEPLVREMIVNVLRQPTRLRHFAANSAVLESLGDEEGE